MTTKTISKKAYCKNAIFVQAGDKQTLQAKMTAALVKLRKVGARKEEQGEDQNYVRTVIYYRTVSSMLFGVLASFERGTHQLTVAEDDEAEVLTVEQVAPPKTDQDKRREFLEGTCYFGVLKNHVVLVSSQSLNAKAEELHFNWLMEHAGVLGEGNRVALSDQVTKVTRERIKAAHVKEVQIGAPLFDLQQGNTAPALAGTQLKSVNYTGLGLDILRQVVGEDFINKLRLADAVDGNIEVSLSVRYKRTTNTKAQKVLDNIALAMRNIDEDEVKLTLDSGGTIKGRDLKLSNLLRVEGRDGIPNPDALFEKMREWLQQLLENHIIEP
jgi:hypothetical protein